MGIAEKVVRMQVSGFTLICSFLHSSHKAGLCILDSQPQLEVYQLKHLLKCNSSLKPISNHPAELSLLDSIVPHGVSFISKQLLTFIKYMTVKLIPFQISLSFSLIGEHSSQQTWPPLNPN